MSMVKAKEIETAFFIPLGIPVISFLLKISIITSPTNRYLELLVCWQIKQYQQKTTEEYFNYWDHFREWEFDTKKDNDSSYS